MRLILEHTGRLAIDILPGSCAALHSGHGADASWPAGAQEPGGHARGPATAPGSHAHHTTAEPGERRKPLDLSAYGTAEEALFSVLMFLLQRTLRHTGQIPTHTVLDSVVRAFDVLLTSGKLPDPNPWDRSFLALLLVALEQTANHHSGDREWLGEIIAHVRGNLYDLGTPDDNGNDHGGDPGNNTGNNDPDHGGPGGSPGGNAAGGNSSPSGGSNGQVMSEWRGSPTNGVSTDDAPLDMAATNPVKKKK